MVADKESRLASQHRAKWRRSRKAWRCTALLAAASLAYWLSCPMLLRDCSTSSTAPFALSKPVAAFNSKPSRPSVKSHSSVRTRAHALRSPKPFRMGSFNSSEN
eukprot:3048308-Rhodomonas_salina.1